VVVTETGDRRLYAEYSEQSKVTVTLETINGNDLQARITAVIQSGSGPDVIMMLHNWPRLYQNGLAEKVVINSKGTLEAVKWMVSFWKDACDEGALAWDDTSNNRACHANEVAATLNGASIFIFAKRVQRVSPEDAVQWGESELKKAYEG
jgi:extracellular solute-binding protein